MAKRVLLNACGCPSGLCHEHTQYCIAVMAPPLLFFAKEKGGQTYLSNQRIVFFLPRKKNFPPEESGIDCRTRLESKALFGFLLSLGAGVGDQTVEGVAQFHRRHGMVDLATFGIGYSASLFGNDDAKHV